MSGMETIEFVIPGIPTALCNVNELAKEVPDSE